MTAAAPPFDVAEKCRRALGTGSATPSRKLIVAESLDEEIAIYGQGWSGHRSGSVLRHPQPTSGKFHPHEKPIGLLQAILDKAPPGPVLDLTAGSGSTAVAAARLGRPCTAVEIVDEWIPTIRMRVATEGAQQPLFGARS